ncbi:hypothetical protein FISHEDRAFT_76985 [Fistulina hepatica ATCC 64428]|uniref:separase n=1 Tax=Fistulina hepatica ATCC 64428 TaxID=1128425 RepID=A0A0D7A3K1_9AGAR|nr:hypothetical protein FISHEDRAFT_76985 [Fistulina hepatica ATCC 64428]
MPVDTSRKTTGTTASVKARLRPRSALPKARIAKNSTVDRLADQLSSGLDLNDAGTKPKIQSDDEKRRESMLIANEASQTLSEIVQSGWRHDPAVKPSATKPSILSRCEMAAAHIAKHLAILRRIRPVDVDIERAAVSATGKLISLRLHHLAHPIIEGSNFGLRQLLGLPQLPKTTTNIHLVSIESTNADPSLLGIVATYLLQAFIVVLHTVLTKSPAKVTPLVQALAQAPTVLTWLPLVEAHMPPKQRDGLLTRIYSVCTHVTASSTCVGPLHIFAIRLYGLKCLMHARRDTLQPTVFWNQVVWTASALMQESGNDEDRTATRRVLLAFEELVTCAEKIVDGAGAMKADCTGFSAFCQYWAALAERVRDCAALDRITAVVRLSLAEASRAVIDGKGDIADARALEGARLCATFAQLTLSLEQGNHDDTFLVRVHEVVDVIAGTTILRAHEHDKIAAKVGRALERLRRAALKVVGVPAIRQLLLSICDVYEKWTSEDALTPTLDTLFTLSRTELSTSYITAHDLLCRANTMLSQHAPSYAIANYLRCVSGAFHNLAGTLYNAERHGAAVPFLKDACTLGQQALSMRVLFPCGVGDKNEEGWVQLEDQLYRRWELLGICHFKTSDRRSACHAFIEGIRAFPYSKSGLADRLARVGLVEAFADSPSTKQLGELIERVTYISTSDLRLQPQTISLRSMESLESSVVAALIEKQVRGMEESRWKDEVRHVVGRLLVDALNIYRECGTPVRCSRVLLKCLEHAYYDNNIMDGMADAETMVQEVEQLLHGKSFGNDTALSVHIPQYRAMAHIWAALHVHRRGDSNHVELIQKHVTEACRILNKLIVRQTAVAAPVAVATKSSSGIKKTTATKSTRSIKNKAVPKIGRSAFSKAEPSPVTPNRQARKGLREISVNTLTPPKSTVASQWSATLFDEFDRLIDLLRLASSVLGVLSLTVAKIQVLHVIRRLCDFHSGTANDAYILASVDVAYEYLQLGKVKHAISVYNSLVDLLQYPAVSDEIRALFQLRFAESLAVNEDLVRSSDAYRSAVDIAIESPQDMKGASTFHRIHHHVAWLERAAVAAHVCGLLQDYQGKNALAFDALLQSFRLWNRALDALARLQPVLSPKPDDDNPFAAPADNDDEPQKPVKKAMTHRSGIEYRISAGLLTTMFAICNIYYTRGSPQQAEFFAQQAQDFAEMLDAPAMTSRALAKKGEIQLRLGRLEESHASLTQASQQLSSVSGTFAAELRRLLGDYTQYLEDSAGALHLYTEAMAMLEELENSFAKLQGAEPRKYEDEVKEVTGAELLTTILRRQLWLLKDGDKDSFGCLMQIFESLISSSRTKAEEHALVGQLTLHDVYERFNSDMFLSSISESTIALPTCMSSNDTLPTSRSVEELCSLLEEAEKHFLSHLRLVFANGEAHRVRAAIILLAMTHAIRTSLGGSDDRSSFLAANLLDYSSAITLRRETLEAIRYKFPSFQIVDDTHWPRLQETAARSRPIKPPSKSKSRDAPHRRSFDSDEEDACIKMDEGEEEQMLRKYWDSVKARYEANVMGDTDLYCTPAGDLPAHWTVVHIAVTEDKRALFISRQRGAGGSRAEPLVFCVPLKGRRDDDDEECLSFQDARNEFAEIIRQSDATIKAAGQIKNNDADARSQWWKERGDLDRRMRELLENIEFCWLGAFKTILSPKSDLPPESLLDLRLQIERVFRLTLRLPDPTHHRTHRKTASQSHISAAAATAAANVRLDDALIECFSSLSPKCRDEELEDLIYFILDLYQFHGIPVSIAEIDIIQVVVDLRGVLEEHAGRLRRAQSRSPKKRSRSAVRSAPAGDEHLFLILDKNVQCFPWESIPILRGRSVSRVPSIDFLVDRVQMAALKSPPGTTVDRHPVDPRSGYYLVNPGGDLSGTQARFEPWLRDMKNAGWEGTVGRAPSEQQFVDALRRKDLVIYLGHGGAEKYVRAHKIRQLPKCAATMLWGCSSGLMRDMGDFDPVGTPYTYMAAGCPCLVVNMWDVTDKEIDKVTRSVIEQLDLNGASVRQWNAGAAAQVSVVSAVAQSRDSCKLKYLTGAAPVVYGIPFYL